MELWSKKGKPHFKLGEACLQLLWHKCSVPEKTFQANNSSDDFSFLEWKRGMLGEIICLAQSHKKSQQFWGCFLNGMLGLDINRKAQSISDQECWKLSPQLMESGGGGKRRGGFTQDQESRINNCHYRFLQESGKISLVYTEMRIKLNTGCSWLNKSESLRCPI